MDYIKYIDYFSIKFNFYTNYQPNYQNLFGGIMTLIYIFICIIIFIEFSYEDIYRLNPTTTISEIPDSEAKIINMNKEKIWIPFRMVNFENKFINHRGILHVVPYFIEGKYNNNSGMELKYHLLNYRLCNETSMANKPNNYKINVPLNELYCIEQDNVLFGGSWNNNFINYIEINLYLCESDIYFNSSDTKCSKIDNFLKFINSSLIFDFYYPVVQFQPTNYRTPMAIIYKNYFYRLSTYSHKIEKIYIQEHILSDDKNILKSNFKNSSCWGISSIYGDDYYLPDKYDPIAKSNSNIIFSLNIYMDSGLIYYTRSYKKIILIISNVFPLFRFVLYFIKKFTQHAKMSITKRRLTGLIFENNKNIKPKIYLSNKLLNLNKNSNQNDIKSNVESKKSKFELEKDKDIDNNLIDRISLNKKNDNAKNILFNNILEQKDNNKSNICLNEENNPITILNNKDILSINKNDKSQKLIDQKKVKFPPKKMRSINRKKNNYIFPYYYFFLDIFFDKLINPQKFFCVKRAYFTVYNFMCQVYDISTHIILFKQFNLLNNMVLEKIYDENGICPTKPFNKINISDIKTIEKLNKDLRTKKSILFSNNLL